MGHSRLTREIPIYLKPYIAKQDPSLYTAIDHASWRYILKISQAFFAQHAHEKYLKGLAETGISTESIPLIDDMDRCLRAFNWRAVPVTGFIPPAAFMEFLSLGVLPIACDMRTLDHLAYTPAPDIVHEAAGHAPIIADAEYAAYLRSYGEISRKAIYSDQDMNVYYAIRYLSDTKEDPKSTPEVIAEAQRRLDLAIANVTYESEATLLSRMAWWTFEYGLVGSMTNPKIYGAGLLSSMSESASCLGPQVKKIPFSIECIRTSYDITRPQPQLFVSPDFQTLRAAIDQLADKMAFRIGGVEGLNKALQAKTVTTVVLNSGVQITGILSGIHLDPKGRPDYLKWSGPCQLAYEDKEIEGQGAEYHREGFSSPIEEISVDQLHQAGWSVGKKGKVTLSSGVTIEGIWEGIVKKEGKAIIFTFDQCTARRGEEILFRPEWGKFDVVSGSKVVSVFGGAADREKYLEATGGFQQEPGRQKTNLTPENRELNDLYARVRKFRETAVSEAQLGEIHRELDKKYPNDWLLRYELLELATLNHFQAPWTNQLRGSLNEIAKKFPEQAETIRRGLELLH